MKQVKSLSIIVVISFVSLNSFCFGATVLPSFYTTVDQFENELLHVIKPPLVSIERIHGVRTVIRASRSDHKTNTPTDAVLFICGMHAREHITMQLCRRLFYELFLPTIRSQTELTYVMIPFMNEWGLREVERGQTCLRKNQNLVDLNRNYHDIEDVGSHCRHHYFRTGEEWEGPNAYSEPETQAILDIIKRFHITRVFDFHSGEHSVYGDGPDSRSNHLIRQEQHLRMRKVLNKVQSLHACPECHQRIGSASQLSTYQAFCTLNDWALLQPSVIESWTLEIYGNERERDCWKMFNPENPTVFDHTLTMWLQVTQLMLNV